MSEFLAAFSLGFLAATLTISGAFTVAKRMGWLPTVEQELRAWMRAHGYGWDSNVDTLIWSFFRNRSHGDPR